MKTKKSKNKSLSAFLSKHGPSVLKFEQINLLFGGAEDGPGTHDLYGDATDITGIYDQGGKPGSKPKPTP
jgi:hypothetical protein